METSIDNIIESVLADLKDKIENGILSDTETNQKLNDQFMKMLDDSSSSSCDSTSSSDDENDNSKTKSKIFIKKKLVEDESDEDEDDNPKIRNQKYIKTKDELTIEDLGPVEIVDIIVDPGVKLEKIGKVISKVDNKLVVIQSVRDDPSKDPPTLDEETYLFDSNRKSIGKIFETFGPVTNPFYVIRFNDLNEITDRKLSLEIDSEVLYAKSNQYTKFVFNIDQLRKQKGSDASWSNDNEPPRECLDYSDDEQEKLAKKQLKEARTKIAGKYSDSESEDESVEKKSPQKNFRKQSNPGFAQKRKHDQRQVNNNYSNGQNYQQQQQQQAQPMMPYFYPGQMYPPQAYPFYANPQMYNYQYAPQMYPQQGFNYYQQPQMMPNANQNFRQINQQNNEKKIPKNNSNIVKKSF